MKQYVISRISGQPDWDRIPSLSVDQVQWLPNPDIAMTARLCYNGQGLYVRLRAKEQQIRAEHREPLAMVCEDSCMEFFFSPVAGDLRYFNFEINPLGHTYIGFGGDRAVRVRLIPKNEDMLLDKHCCCTEDGWQVTYTIPLAFLRNFVPDFSFRSGLRLRGNFYKCGDLTEQPHFLAWNPVETPEPDFHRPECFGELIFE